MLHKEDLAQGIAGLGLRVFPYTAEHAFGVFDLPLHHPDAFERQIITQALAEDSPLVTPDRTFRLCKNLKTPQ